MSRTPIVLFVYNRPWHTRQTVEALKKNQLASESDLIVYSDGPKSSLDSDKVGEVRDYLRQIDGFKSIRIYEREKNYGLANSVIQGVADTVNEYGKVIVLEDDLITSSYFLRYMNEALERYQNEYQVMQISGYMFPVQFNSGQDAFFLPFTTSWGWATWRRAWTYFDPAASGYLKLEQNKSLRKKFDLNGAYPYFNMLESQLRGEIDSWAIRWYLSVFVNNGLVLYPQTTLVINNGFDGSGTHCGSSSRKQMEPACSGAVVLPASVSVNQEALSKIAAYLPSLAGSGVGGLVKFIVERFRNLLG